MLTWGTRSSESNWGRDEANCRLRWWEVHECLEIPSIYRGRQPTTFFNFNWKPSQLPFFSFGRFLSCAHLMGPKRASFTDFLRLFVDSPSPPDLDIFLVPWGKCSGDRFDDQFSQSKDFNAIKTIVYFSIKQNTVPWKQIKPINYQRWVIYSIRQAN